jgi:hypothetical protein
LQLGAGTRDSRHLLAGGFELGLGEVPITEVERNLCDVDPDPSERAEERALAQ